SEFKDEIQKYETRLKEMTEKLNSSLLENQKLLTEITTLREQGEQQQHEWQTRYNYLKDRYEEMKDQLRKQIRDSFLKEEKLKKFNKLRAYHNQQKNDLQEKINMMAAKMGETASLLEEQQR